MKHFSMACILGLLVAPVCIAQNGLKGLRDYLQEYKFSLFVPPRANATLDTVVNYSGGYETIVTSKCIPTDKVKPSELSTVVLTAKTGNLTKT